MNKYLWSSLRIVIATLFVVLIFLLITVNPVIVLKKSETGNTKASSQNIKSNINKLTNLTPARDYRNISSIDQSADLIYSEFSKLACDLEEQSFESRSNNYRNIICLFNKNANDKIIIGAHYDVMGEQPGADDNASGVAALLELARLLGAYKNLEKLNHSIELVAFSLEEPPHFKSDKMGSYIHAQSLKSGKDKIKLMISLEMLGFYNEKNDSQDYPSPLLKLIYPDRGNFIAIVGKYDAFIKTRSIKRSFKKNSNIETWSINAPNFMPGIDFSDHLNYWDIGIDAVMITDTAFYRNPNYHEYSDTIDTLDIDKIAEVVDGLFAFLVDS